MKQDILTWYKLGQMDISYTPKSKQARTKENEAFHSPVSLPTICLVAYFEIWDPVLAAGRKQESSL